MLDLVPVGERPASLHRFHRAVSSRWAHVVLFFVVPAAIIASILAAGGAGDQSDPHSTGKLVAPAGANEVAYCDSCHKTGCPAPHPEGVRLTWAARGRTVLDAAGNLTCGSCHTRRFRSRENAFLARDQKGLCEDCHFAAHAVSNVHTISRNCGACHAHPVAAGQPGSALVRAMQANVDSECRRCHYDGPITHPVGVPNSKDKAPDLPLAANGAITCVTCHVGHQQEDKFGSLLRADNRRGGLCLKCHDDL
jgi:predicted CXXCH cytochrome family protein